MVLRALTFEHFQVPANIGGDVAGREPNPGLETGAQSPPLGTQ